METKVVSLGTLLLGGMSFYGDPISVKGSWDSDNEIGKTWKRFMEYMAENPKRPYSVGKPQAYEVHIYGDETLSKGYFEVFIGEEVGSAQLPVVLSVKYIPASDYLRLTLYGCEIVSDWGRELDTKLFSAAGVTRNPGYIIQAYDGRFLGMDRVEESVLDVYIPVLSNVV